MTEPLNIYSRSVYEEIRRAAPEIPEDVARAAVSWIKTGELDRHYGPGFTIAYALKYALPVALADGAGEGAQDGA